MQKCCQFVSVFDICFKQCLAGIVFSHTIRQLFFNQLILTDIQSIIELIFTLFCIFVPSFRKNKKILIVFKRHSLYV